MGNWLKQSTAVEIALGPFVDSTDGFTPETGLTITEAEVFLKKNGGDWADKSEATSLVHESNGWYRCLLDTTDTNTLGELIVQCYESGALPCWREFMVVPANVWDSLFGADYLQVDATQLLGTAFATPTVAGVQEVDVTHWNGTAIPAVHTAGYPIVTVKDGTGTGEINTSSGTVLAADTAGNAIATATNLAVVAGYLDTEIAAIKAVTDALPNSGALTTIQSDLDNIQTRLPTSLVGGRMDSDIGAIQGSVSDSIAGNVWDEDATSHQTQGTFGQAIGDPVADTNTIFKAVVTDATGATVGVDVVAVQADTDNIQTRIPAALVSGRIDASVGAMAADTITAAAIATNAIDSDALAASALAEINAEVVDALNVDTYAEPGQEAPAATTSLAAKINYIYKAFRNKITQTGTTLSIYDDAGSTVDQKATVSDDGTTYTRGEIGTGP